MENSLLSTKTAATYLGVSAAFLERDRCYEGRIPFIRVGSRAVRYRPTDLDAYIERQQRRNTADPGPGMRQRNRP